MNSNPTYGRGKDPYGRLWAQASSLMLLLDPSWARAWTFMWPSGQAILIFTTPCPRPPKLPPAKGADHFQDTGNKLPSKQ